MKEKRGVKKGEKRGSYNILNSLKRVHVINNINFSRNEKEIIKEAYKIEDKKPVGTRKSRAEIWRGCILDWAKLTIKSSRRGE